MRRVRSVSNTVDAVRRLESPAFRRGEYQWQKSAAFGIRRTMVKITAMEVVRGK